MNHGWKQWMTAAFLLLLCGATVRAQMLAGTWTADSEKAIDKARKTDLRVIVMDAQGRPARDAKVVIDQTTSRFHVGVVLPESGWPERPTDTDQEPEFWRCINAVSIEQMTPWPKMQPKPGLSLNEFWAIRIDQTLDQAESHGYCVRWGSLISADAGRLPDWAASLTGEELADAVTGYAHRITERFGGRIDQYDVYTDTLDHNRIESRAEFAVIRRLYESLPVASPGAEACARFDDGLSFDRTQKMLRQLTAMHEAFIPVKVVAIDQRFGGTLERRAVERMLSRIDPIGQPVVFSGLAVGGDSEINAAVNLETLLRTLMEHAGVEGIWFNALTPDTAIDPNSTLLDENGQPTPSGDVVDNLFHDLWRTHVDSTTDELGNVMVRAFPGTYHITATLADGTVLETEFVLEKSEDPRVVLLEPLHPGQVLGGDH